MTHNHTSTPPRLDSDGTPFIKVEQMSLSEQKFYRTNVLEFLILRLNILGIYYLIVSFNSISINVTSYIVTRFYRYH